ncbi:MAG: Threonine/homoserine efflux transporter RhtA [Candidatus Nitrotoga sp. LAW]|nr:MAG: Threonine/homoserine efflux transporter RhtA [Candidatus Nitrotoga sp. LAW]
MNTVRLAAYTALAMAAFAANSLLCRLALKETAIDAASFTTVRILSGAAMLWLMMRWRAPSHGRQGSWYSAVALFIYVAAFSFAYLSLSAGTGALLLFGAVQVTMILAGFMTGERMSRVQSMGFIAALAGLVILVLPGVEAPTLVGSALMLASGVAWGIYSLFGRGIADPAAATTGNFLRAVPLTIVLSLLALPWLKLDASGLLYAVLSGALTSGLGYVLWYRVLQHMHAITASTVQLSAPVLAALGGVVLLNEAFTSNLLTASVLILGGIGLMSHYGKS